MAKGRFSLTNVYVELCRRWNLPSSAKSAFRNTKVAVEVARFSWTSDLTISFHAPPLYNLRAMKRRACHKPIIVDDNTIMEGIGFSTFIYFMMGIKIVHITVHKRREI